TKADGEVHFFASLVLFFAPTYFVADQDIPWYYSETDLRKKIRRNMRKLMHARFKSSPLLKELLEQSKMN
ncbi:hypothetical protein Csa_020783, partial [Cucumis sativus]